MDHLKWTLIILGAVVTLMGWRERQLSLLSKQEAAPMTLAELEANGPEDNAHVVLSDFFLCNWDYLYQEEFGGRWADAWVPAVALGGVFHTDLMGRLDDEGYLPEGEQPPNPGALKVVFKITDSPSEESVDALAMEDEVQGMVINEIDKLDSESRRLLASSYPGVDFSDVYIFEPGRAPKGAGGIHGMIGGGVAMCLVGIGLVVAGRTREFEVSPEP